MNQRITAAFHPGKQGKKTQFYKRITRLVAISVIVNLLILSLYAVPYLVTQFKKRMHAPPDENRGAIKERLKDTVAFDFDHPAYLYAGHSFPKDSTEFMVSREVHFAGLLAQLDPALEQQFKVHTQMHKVLPGETLYTIAKIYHVSMESIRAYNGMYDNGIKAGMILKIMTAEQPIGYYGIDVSSWQNSIDWKAVHADTVPSPLKFYIIKATQGKDITDFYFAHNWANAPAVNAILGAYHFYVAGDDPALQADNYIRSVKLRKGDFRPIIDLEYDCSNCNSLPVPKEQFITGLNIFLRRIEKQYGVKPVLYTFPYFYDQYLKGHFDAYTYWMASYTEKAPMDMNLFGTPDAAMLPAINMWQFSSSERVSGVAGNVDVSFLPAEDLKAMLY